MSPRHAFSANTEEPASVNTRPSKCFPLSLAVAFHLSHHSAAPFPRSWIIDIKFSGEGRGQNTLDLNAGVQLRRLYLIRGSVLLVKFIEDREYYQTFTAKGRQCSITSAFHPIVSNSGHFYLLPASVFFLPRSFYFSFDLVVCLVWIQLLQTRWNWRLLG